MHLCFTIRVLLFLVLHNLAIVCLASLKGVVAIYTASCSWLARTAANVDSTFVIIKDAFAKQLSLNGYRERQL